MAATIVRRGARALVTGASSGIGAAFARELGRRGLDLVLTARSDERLEALANELRASYATRVETIAADLAEPAGIARVGAVLESRTVDVLINNAGFGTRERFAEADAERTANMIALNVSAVVALARIAAPGMVSRGGGAIVNVASTAAFQACPYMSVYGATKAFVLSFSTALAAELAGTGVRVTALCPGATETAFFAGMQRLAGSYRTPAQVVGTGLRALERGRSVAIDGPQNNALAAGSRFLPRGVVTALSARLLRPSAP